MPNYYLLHNYSGSLQCVVPEDDVRATLVEFYSDVPAHERIPMMDALIEVMRHWGDISTTGVLFEDDRHLLGYLELEIDRLRFNWRNPESEVGSEASLKDVDMPAGWWAAVAQTIEGWLWEVLDESDVDNGPIIVAYDSTPYPTREDAMDEAESWVVGYLNATRYSVTP